MFKILNPNKGFTLIEMMVTAVIFSIIIGTVTGVFVSTIRLQKYNLAYQRLLDQTSYAMEYMDRAIRMAKKSTGSACVFANKNYNETVNSIEFETYHSLTQCWKFFRDVETDSYGQFGKLKVEKDGIPYDLTSDDFDVKSFNVVVSGGGIDDDLQPRVTIFMEVRGRDSDFQPKIKIQTTISQRDLDM